MCAASEHPNAYRINRNEGILKCPTDPRMPAEARIAVARACVLWGGEHPADGGVAWCEPCLIEASEPDAMGPIRRFGS